MLRLRTFGGLSLERDGAPIDGASTQRKALAVLAQLAVAGDRGVSRSKLVGRLWAERDEELARRALAQALYQLRQSLREDTLVLGAAELRLHPAMIASDVGEFECAIAAGDLIRAAEVYKGPFLDGVYISDAPEFERWVDGERARLAAAYAKAVECLATAPGTAPADAVLWWRMLANADPLNARHALGLMRALAAAGNTAAALDHARVYEALVREELDAEADASIVAYARALRAHAPTAPTPGLAAPPLAAPPLAAPPLAAQPPISTPSDVAPRPRRTYAPGLIALAAGLALVAVLGFWRREPARGARGLDAHRVLIAVFDNNTGDTTLAPIGRMAADWIAQRLGETGLVEVVDVRSALLASDETDSLPHLPGGRIRSLADQTGAGTVVLGSYYKDGDSLRFQAQVSDATRGRLLFAIPPVSVSVTSPLAGVDIVRERVTGGLAVQFNPRLSDFVRQTRQPPTYGAYRETMLGMDDFAKRNLQPALAHWLRAAALDTTYVSPLIYATHALRETKQYARADSLITAVLASRDRLSPRDQLFAEGTAAELHGDFGAARGAFRQMTQIAPSTESYMILAETDGFLNRPREALDALAHVDPNRGWLKGWENFYSYPAAEYHTLGDHDRELEVVQRGRAAFPRGLAIVMITVRALAAQGRVAAIDSVLDASLTMPGPDLAHWIAMKTAARELYAHGYDAAAKHVAERELAWIASKPAAVRASVTGQSFLASALIDLGNLTAADSILTLVWRAQPTEEILGLRGRIAARRGMTDRARAIMDSIAAMPNAYLYGQPELDRAAICATLGDRDQAMALLRQAVAAGYTYLTIAHVPEFRSLRTYPPFVEFMRPTG